MAAFKEYESCDAVELAQLIQSKQVAPEEVLEAAIEKTEALNPKLNAVVTKMYDQAQEAIKAGLPDGPLTGVPFLLKDLAAHYQGVPTTGGSKVFADYVPDHDSELVASYKEAGLVIFGKTNTPEFGLTITTESVLLGACRNPWNLERTTGGSSGGAAAAVASGMVPVAHASDGGGSIRIPASCCGLFGIKPTRGRVPSGPDRGEGWAGMSCQHAVSRTVRDSALFLDVARGPGLGDPYWAPPLSAPYIDEIAQEPGKLKIAFTTVPPTEVEADAECVTATQNAAKLCESLGHTVVEASPQFDTELFSRSTLPIISASIAADVSSRLEVLNREMKSDDVEKVTATFVERGQNISGPDYVKAVQGIHAIGRQVAPFFQEYDILLSPVLLTPPIPLGILGLDTDDLQAYGEAFSRFFGFTNLFNATGQPSMSVPLHWSEDGLPVGLQFTASFGNEALLFRLAAQLEQAQPWKDRRPDLS